MAGLPNQIFYCTCPHSVTTQGKQMRRVGMLIAVVMGVMLVAGRAGLVYAENRSIEQLPDDLFRWSTMWIKIPQEMMVEGQEPGPLAALTMGPANGTAAMVEETGQDVWSAAKPDKRPGHRRPDGGSGAIFCYEF